MTVDSRYVPLTESWGMPMPAIEQDMVYSRYRFFADIAEGGDVVEVGAGQGLGNEELIERCQSVVSCDLEIDNIARARDHVGGRFLASDAQRLPFSDHSFDAAAACEMIYYVADQKVMMSELRRVLRPGGRAFIVTANPERPGFHHSPHSTHYPSARDLHRLLASNGFEPEIYGVFPLDQSFKGRLLRLASRVATKLHLVPKTLAGRGFLKKFFFGELTPYTGLDGPRARAGELAEPKRVAGDRACTDFRVLYGVGRLTA
jgi:ubiquinone/menaquinone biosynthesis C-methylase UbiE